MHKEQELPGAIYLTGKLIEPLAIAVDIGDYETASNILTEIDRNIKSISMGVTYEKSKKNPSGRRAMVYSIGGSGTDNDTGTFPDNLDG